MPLHRALATRSRRWIGWRPRRFRSRPRPAWTVLPLARTKSASVRFAGSAALGGGLAWIIHELGPFVQVGPRKASNPEQFAPGRRSRVRCGGPRFAESAPTQCCQSSTSGPIPFMNHAGQQRPSRRRINPHFFGGNPSRVLPCVPAGPSRTVPRSRRSCADRR